MNDEARAILSENIIGVLATVNQDGSPWANPVHTFFDDEAIYWFSYADKQHSLNIDRDPRISLTVFSPDLSRGPKGVYINGQVQKLDVDETTAAQKLRVARIGKVPVFFEGTVGYKLKFGELNSSKTSGNCWYFYT